MFRNWAARPVVYEAFGFLLLLAGLALVCSAVLLWAWYPETSQSVTTLRMIGLLSGVTTLAIGGFLLGEGLRLARQRESGQRLEVLEALQAERARLEVLEEQLRTQLQKPRDGDR